MKLVVSLLSLLGISLFIHSNCEASDPGLSEQRRHDDQVMRSQIQTLTSLDEEHVRTQLTKELQIDYKNIVPTFGTVTADDFGLGQEWGWYPKAYGLTRFKDKAQYQWGHIDLAGFKINTLKLDPLSNSTSKLVIFAHGYLDHLGCSSNFYEELIQNGISVVSFDLPGHGFSSGIPGSVDDFVTYANVLSKLVHYFEKDYSEVVLVGFSTGASTILEAQRLGLISPLHKKVFVSPLIRVAFYWLLEPSFKIAYFARTEWDWTLLDFAISPRRWVQSNSHDPLILEFMEKDPLSPLLVPAAWTNAYIQFADRNKTWLEGLSRTQRENFGELLVLQGGKDRVVDGSGNVDFLKRQLPHAKVKWFNQGGHHLLNEGFTAEGDLLPIVYREVLDFIL